MIPEDEKQERIFFDEGAGPPKITDDELAWLDQEAVQAELKRLRKLDVIEDVGKRPCGGGVHEVGHPTSERLACS